MSYMRSRDTQEAGVWFTFVAKRSAATPPKVPGASGGAGAQTETVSGPCQRFLKDLNYVGRLN